MIIGFFALILVVSYRNSYEQITDQTQGGVRLGNSNNVGSDESDRKEHTKDTEVKEKEVKHLLQGEVMETKSTSRDMKAENERSLLSDKNTKEKPATQDIKKAVVVESATTAKDADSSWSPSEILKRLEKLEKYFKSKMTEIQESIEDVQESLIQQEQQLEEFANRREIDDRDQIDDEETPTDAGKLIEIDLMKLYRRWMDEGRGRHYPVNERVFLTVHSERFRPGAFATEAVSNPR